MTNQQANSHSLNFSVHNHSLAPSYSVPELEVYQSQKKIQVVSVNQDPLHFGNVEEGESTETTPQNAFNDAAHNAFFDLRLSMALGNRTAVQPSYFPGAVIPSPGGSTCSEFNRGNLLFDQFKHVLSFDSEMVARLQAYQAAGGVTVNREEGPSRLFCNEVESNEAWLWQYIEAPKMYFVYQASIENGEAISQEAIQSALDGLQASATKHFEAAQAENHSDQSLSKLLGLIADAWFSPASGLAPVTWDSVAFSACREALNHFQGSIDAHNLLPFLFELEAMASHVSLDEKRESFARGVFAGNFIDVAMAPLTSFKATEFCVRERLFDEVINLSSRGFAPVIINEYGLVADGNHRLTASYVWNVLKYAQDLEWSLDNEEFQKRIAAFPQAVANGLLKNGSEVSPVSLHQALNHLAYFLRRPDWRARLNSYTRPLLKRHDFIHELPVVVLPEYLSGAVVKAGYDEGTTVERACPSIYEAMSLNDHLVLPPRASYHFTDAALLPWFTVLKTSCGTRRRAGSFSRRPRVIRKR